MPAYVDFQVAVLLGHGSNSKYSGKIYSYSAGFEVLKSADMTIDEIKYYLSYNLYYTKSESSTDGGEVGLFSFNESITTHPHIIRTWGSLGMMPLWPLFL